MTDYICIECGYEGRRKAVKRGSTTMEIMLWVVFLIPGPFYTLWRIFTKYYVCPMCESKTMFSVNSALGKRKLALLNEEIGNTTPSTNTLPTHTTSDAKPPLPNEKRIEKPASIEKTKKITSPSSAATPTDPNEW